LIKTADALRIGCNHAKERLFLCRFGGDEFVIASTEPQEEDNEKLVEAIRQSVNRTVLYRDKTFTIEISIGQASGPFDSLEDAEHLLLQADMRMYEDKKRQSLV
jgi:diguanylate cyclase (GGDEF)-like protein